MKNKNTIYRISEALSESKKCLNLYHSTTNPLGTDGFRMKGNAGYGAYFAKTVRDSRTFGDITYKVKICPENTLVFNDNEVKGKGFFNMNKETYDKYISKGYDSLAWYKGGVLKEFIVLKKSIIIDYEYIN